MDNEKFLQHLRERNLEDGCAYVREQCKGVADYAAIGILIKDEALRQQNINPLISLKLAEVLIFFGEYTHHAPSRALGLIARGDALRLLGQYQAALDCLDRAGEAFLQLGDQVGWARSRIGWILAATWMGRTEEALEQATQAREVFLHSGEYARVFAIDHNTAMIYTRMGRYNEAIALYEQMRKLYPTLQDQPVSLIKRGIAQAATNQANNLSWLGRYDEAYQLLYEAQKIFIELEQPLAAIYAEMCLAEYDYAQGYYGSALHRYYQARDSMLQHSVDDRALLAELKLRITECLIKLSRAEEAAQLVFEAVETYRDMGMSLDTAEALSLYATTLIACSRPRDAIAVLDEALLLFQKGGFDHYVYAIKLQQAELLLLMGKLAEAYEVSHGCREYFAPLHMVPRFVQASLLMVEAFVESEYNQESLHEKDGAPIQLQSMVQMCRDAALLARRHNVQELVYKSHYLSGRLACLRRDMHRAHWHYAAAIAQVERILQNLAYDLSPSFLHTASNVYGEMILLCLQQGDTVRAFTYLEQARSTALRQYLKKSHREQERIQIRPEAAFLFQDHAATVLRMQYELKEWQERYRKYSVLLADIDNALSQPIDREVLQEELQKCEAQISTLFERLSLLQSDIPYTIKEKRQRKSRDEVIRAEQVQQHIETDQLVLTYYLYKRNLVIFAMTQQTIVAVESPDGATQLERLLPLLHAHLQPGGWPDPARPPQQGIRRLLQKLYTLLIAPVEAYLPETGYVTIVPFGPLHTLPFHALYDGWAFLIERFQMHYLPATNMLLPLSEQYCFSGGQSQLKKQPLVFGYSDNGQLPAALDEAKQLAQILDGRCYLEQEASIVRLTEEVAASPIIHIATHGKSRLDAPNFSYIRFADGRLNAIDVFGLNLKGCELVTLSGCETGLSYSSGGDEQIGLGRAFLSAGTASLVMSSWPVEDAVTGELMRLFYQYLLLGETKIQALRLAQVDLIQRQGSPSAHPYFWAAFRLVGDTGPLHHRTFST